MSLISYPELTLFSKKATVMKSKTHLFSKEASVPFSEFNDYELQATMHDFLEEEEKEKSSIWNIATIAGLAMFFVSMLYVLQLLGLLSGLTGWMNALPVLGAVLILFVGFGFWVGDRKRVKRILKKQRKKRKEYFDAEFGNVSSDSGEGFSLKNDLFDKSNSSEKNNPFSASEFDKYALGQSKKLYKSRTDKKLTGVCGGLSKYFGISSNVLRLLFVITIFVSGASIFVYIGLALALDKEPPELIAMEDYDY